MKHVSILVPQGAVLGSVEGPRQVLTEVNKYLKSVGKSALFNVQLVGLTESVPAAGGKYTVFTDAQTSTIRKTDLIIIPALDGDLQRSIETNQAFLPWIVDQYQRGAEVGSLCVGAFLLASTGLLNGRQCATHWMAAHQFKNLFPEVQLVEDRIITDEQGLYSSGGAFSYLNLILYLIEKHAGRHVAVFMSKAFQIEIERNSQSPFIIFHGQKEHGDEAIRKAQEHIENNLEERITVDQLASLFAIGRRNLERRFKKATANSVVEYIQRVKIEAAKMRLESSRENINEVMYGVGYTDPKAFRSTFKRITGLSPIEYRQKYNREALIG
ncbi:GlxA family transcriptional regulator [Spirosoma sp. KUDC1026]|uniref:GlxA family transcriptional regulator n=1 Tax=Spirosoma sp. KUDC1026 TaxID=2745947 RepID=UPI00159BC763|nr:helix-turn-helix domain-containing protein [Spirosoma sp. KUDC1026]QKZ15064.1 helix-turn-helix domain-containing protein [Spirosoma sp. KUDC1026]